MFAIRIILALILSMSLSLAGFPAHANCCHGGMHCADAQHMGQHDHSPSHPHHDMAKHEQCCPNCGAIALLPARSDPSAQAVAKAEPVQLIEDIHFSQLLWLQDRPPKQIS